MTASDGPDHAAIARATLAHYERQAEAFREGTRGHDVRQNIDAMLSRIEATPPFTILDFGCGPGRDLRAFAALGHVAVGLEGAPSFVAMARVLRELHDTLKPRGVLFASNPHGHNEEGWNRGRYGAYHDLPTWSRYMSEAGFAMLDHYYRPSGLPRDQQPWLASVWRKAD
jgi:SAM-dependent methyltransferase